MNNSWHSYPSIFNVGHKVLQGYFLGTVIAEEKVDGSQFSFGTFDGVLLCRSKGVQLDPETTSESHMFYKAVQTAKKIQPLLQNGWTYRAEYLQSPRHNSLPYDRIPKDHLIIFDINDGEESYLDYNAKQAEAARIGLECVPKLFEGEISTQEQFNALLDNISVLGGQVIEGVVLKRYDLFGKDKKVILAKYVSENFKEIHRAEWKEKNPTGADITETIGNSLKTPARWEKAIIHLKEKGELQDSPKDIGNLFKEVNQDLLKECQDYIKDELFKWAWPKISRISTSGMPEWYKQKLVEKQFKSE